MEASKVQGRKVIPKLTPKRVRQKKSSNMGGRGENIYVSKNEYHHTHHTPHQHLLPHGIISNEARSNLAALEALYRDLAFISQAIEAVTRFVPKLKVADIYVSDQLIKEKASLEAQLQKVIACQLSSFSSAAK